jgi:hypothetical protein
MKSKTYNLKYTWKTLINSGSRHYIHLFVINTITKKKKISFRIQLFFVNYIA